MKFSICIILFSMIFISSFAQNETYHKISIWDNNRPSPFNDSYFYDSLNLVHILIAGVKNKEVNVFNEYGVNIPVDTFYNNFKYFIPEDANFDGEHRCCFGPCRGWFNYSNISLALKEKINVKGNKSTSKIESVSLVVSYLDYEQYDINYNSYKNKPYKLIGQFDLNELKQIISKKRLQWIYGNNKNYSYNLDKALVKRLFVPSQLVLKTKDKVAYNGVVYSGNLFDEIVDSSCFVPFMKKDTSLFKRRTPDFDFTKKPFACKFIVQSNISFNDYLLNKKIRYDIFDWAIKDSTLQKEYIYSEHDSLGFWQIKHGKRSMVYFFEQGNELSDSIPAEVGSSALLDTNKINLPQNVYLDSLFRKVIKKYPWMNSESKKLYLQENIDSLEIYWVQEYVFQSDTKFVVKNKGLRIKQSGYTNPRGMETELFYLPFEKLHKNLKKVILNHDYTIKRSVDYYGDFMKKPIVKPCRAIQIFNEWNYPIYEPCFIIIKDGKVKNAINQILNHLN